MIKFLPLDFLSVSHRIPCKNKNTIYCFQISALVSEIFKSEKWVKYTNEMTDDVIHSTQYCIECIKNYLDQFAMQNIETWQANTSAGNSYEKSHSHGNSLVSSPHPLDFNMLVIFSFQKVK